MELTGKIIAVLPAQSGTSNRTGNPWMSQEYVLETHDQYPRKCCFRVFGLMPREVSGLPGEKPRESHVLQRRESKSFFLIPHKDFS